MMTVDMVSMKSVAVEVDGIGSIWEGLGPRPCQAQWSGVPLLAPLEGR
jgi:hypothetical protein